MMTPELWGRILRIGKIAGVIGAITAAIVSVAGAWPLVEPWMAATRSYAREIVSLSEVKTNTAQKMTLGAVRDIQIEQAVGKRDAALNDIAKWTLELNKVQDDGSKDLINRQVRTLMETKRKLDSQIETLTNARWN